MRFIRCSFFISFVFLFCSTEFSLAHTGTKCSHAFASGGVPILWPDYPHRPYDVLKYQLILDWRKVFETKSQRYSGVNTITLAITDSTPNITLDAGLLKIDSITINGTLLALVPQPTTDEHLIIPLPQNLQNPGSSISLSIAYHKDTLFNLGIYYYPKGTYDPYDQDSIPEDLAYTMSEPTDAHYWMPCNDQPYDKAESEISIIVPNGLETASNGTLINKTVYSPTSTIWHWKSDEPIATYLMVADASNFIHWSETHQRTLAPGDTVHLDYYAWPSDYYQDSITDGSEYNARYFLSRNTSQIMTNFEARYGGFPFVKYGQVPVSPFAFGGMEHQTITTIHRRWLKNDYEGIAHEMSHQWFGDKTTCETFKDIWLNEGFATFSEAIWGEAGSGEAEYMYIIRDKAAGYFYDTQNIKLPPYDPPANDLFNYALTYCKGGCVLHMLRRMVNNDTMFFSALRDYSNAFAYTTANTAQFRDYIGQRLGLDLYEFIDQWIFGAMYPQYLVYWAESPGNTLYLRINQTQSVRDHFTMPVKLFAFHGSQVDTITCENNLRSQGFQKNLGYVIDSLKFDDDALVLSTDTMLYSPSLLPNAVRTGNPMESAFTVYRDGSELICTFSPANQSGTLELYNSLGMKIMDVSVPGGETLKKLDIRNLSSGIYFLRFAGDVRSVNILR
jgi:aminopeptidase N